MTMQRTVYESQAVEIYGAVFTTDVMTSTAAATFEKGTLLGRITLGGKLAPYSSAAADGSEIPIAVLTQEVVFSAAGDLSVRPLVGGQVRAGMLIEHGSGVVTDKAVYDQLRDYSIIPIETTQIAGEDN